MRCRCRAVLCAKLPGLSGMGPAVGMAVELCVFEGTHESVTKDGKLVFTHRSLELHVYQSVV